MITNLTPHAVNIYDYDGDRLVMTVPPSGTVARVSTEAVQVGAVDGAPIYINRYGPIVDLPAPVAGTLYVTSMFVRSATARTDVASPGELKRDAAGQPIGCVGLVVNPGWLATT